MKHHKHLTRPRPLKRLQQPELLPEETKDLILSDSDSVETQQQETLLEKIVSMMENLSLSGGDSKEEQVSLQQTPLDVTLWVMDNESIEKQEMEYLGKTQVAAMFNTQLGGTDMIMKVMLNPHDARTFAEAALLLKIDGLAGAPKLLGYGAEHPMLLLESLPGCNFLHLLQDERAPLSLHMRVIHKVACHLQKLHSLGVIHNDVAIPNVVVHITDDYQLLDVHLIEFTVACLSGQSLAMAVDPQEFPCVAPEIARGGASSPASDIFSLGMMIQEVSRMKAEKLPQQALKAMRKATRDDPQERPNHFAMRALLYKAKEAQRKKEKKSSATSEEADRQS